MGLKPGALHKKEDGTYVFDKNEEALKNSMALAMEDALGKIYKLLNKKSPPEKGQEDRFLLFAAIAQGVVNHLKEYAETAFKVHSVEVTQELNNRVTSSGEVNIGLDNYPVNVTQDNDGNQNKVKSSGEGKIEILTEGELYP